MNPEQVPENMIHVTLPQLQIDDSVKTSLMDITGGIPLELKLFSDYARLEHVEHVTADFVKEFKSWRKSQVKVQSGRFLTTKSIEDKESVILSIGYFIAVQAGKHSVEKLSSDIPVDKRFMYFKGSKPCFLSPIVADSFAEVYTAFLEKQPKPIALDSHGHWYEVQVERLLKEEQDILRLTGNNPRKRVEQVDFEGPRDFQLVKTSIDSLSTNDALYVATPFRSHRFFDGVLVVREHPGHVFILFFNCCAGNKHKDSYSDMETNEVLWRDQVAQWRKSSPGVSYHEGFLWITPTSGSGTVTLTLGGQVKQFTSLQQLQQQSLWKKVFNQRIASQDVSQTGRLEALHLQITHDYFVRV